MERIAGFSRSWLICWVETRRQREAILQDRGTDDQRGTEAIARLAELERSLEAVGIEAAFVHQLLAHVRVI